MTMSQPFKDVWLPRDVDLYFSAMLAIGTFDVRYHLDYSRLPARRRPAADQGRGAVTARDRSAGRWPLTIRRAACSGLGTSPAGATGRSHRRDPRPRQPGRVRRGGPRRSPASSVGAPFTATTIADVTARLKACEQVRDDRRAEAVRVDRRSVADHRRHHRQRRAGADRHVPGRWPGGARRQAPRGRNLMFMPISRRRGRLRPHVRRARRVSEG